MVRLLLTVLLTALFLSILACGTTQSNSNSNQNSGPNETGNTTPALDAEKIKSLREGYKIVAENSQNLNNWCLLIITASIAAIVSTSYLRPSNCWFRAIYLLFIPGWILISLSIFCGVSISNSYISLMLVKNEYVRHNATQIDMDFASQLWYLKGGLFVFGVWLIVFLLFWIFDDKLSTTPGEQS